MKTINKLELLTFLAAACCFNASAMNWTGIDDIRTKLKKEKGV